MSILCERGAHCGVTEFQRIDAENRFKIVQKVKSADGPRQMLTFFVTNFSYLFLQVMLCLIIENM